MEEKINIVEILKDKPQGTKLYSSACGKCKLEEEVDDKSFKISFYNSKFGFMNGGEGYLDKNGKLYDDGECVVFPSKEMRDWSKFAWKRGDVLVSNDGCTEVIFDKWYDDTYTSFYGKHYLDSENENDIVYIEAFICTTDRFFLEDKESFLCYINTIEKRLGGKLNRETLEIEKAQHEFKDGDFVTITFNWGEDIVYIFKSEDSNSYSYYAWLNGSIPTIIESSHPKSDIYTVRLSTEQEKQKLFEALAKEGKAWDAEKKQIVDLKPKWTPKPFDRVLTRTPDTPWAANFFSHIDSDGVKNCIDDRYIMCLPYNEETAKLIGTTDNWKGGKR